MKTTFIDFILKYKVLIFAVTARCLYLTYVVVAIWETFLVKGLKKIDTDLKMIWLLFTGKIETDFCKDHQILSIIYYKLFPTYLLG